MCVCVLITQSCLTLCNPMDCSLPHSSCPGKNTGVGRHALLQGIFPTQGLNSGLPTLRADFLPSEPPGKPIHTVVVQSLSHVRLLQSHGLQPTRLLCPWDFPGKNTGLGCHFLLQEIFPTQGSNPHLHYYRQSPILQADSLPIEPLRKLSPVLYIYTLAYSKYSQIFIKVAGKNCSKYIVCRTKMIISCRVLLLFKKRQRRLGVPIPATPSK